jgi:hypothetical protein
LVVCATFTVMVLEEKFADSMVPVHAPERSANGPAGAVGEGAPDIEPAFEPPHALATQATRTAPATKTRLSTCKYTESFVVISYRSVAQSRARYEQESDQPRSMTVQHYRLEPAAASFTAYERPFAA